MRFSLKKVKLDSQLGRLASGSAQTGAKPNKSQLSAENPRNTEPDSSIPQKRTRKKQFSDSELDAILAQSRKKKVERLENKKNRKRKPRVILPESASARVPQDADDFESVCAEWLKRNGFSDVRRTPKGPDGGIDIIGAGIVGQSKFHPSKAVTAHDIRALYGSKREHRVRHAVFFCFGPGYSDDARKTAKALGVVIYHFVAKSRRFKKVD